MPNPVILAADDSVTVRKLIEISLKKDEFDLHFAVEGAECLSKAVALKPALILLDYILPDMKGIEVCQALMDKPETRDIPVLLISGNGAAIRQTYENASNVADYLTKPFAPNVLNAVVGHLLAKGGRRAEEAAAKELAEVNTAAAEAATNALPEKLLAKIHEALVANLRAPLLAFPGLDAVREGRAADEFFLEFLNSSGAVEKLSRAIVALPDLKPTPVQLRCASDLVPVDAALAHLNETRANGVLRLDLADEAIQLHLEAGEIVFITSNNPKRYCAGAAFPFRSIPQPAIAAAVAAQAKDSTPLFVTLKKQGALPAGTNLGALLLAQGATTLSRAIKASGVTITLEDAAAVIAPELRALRQRHPLPALLLAAYRSVDDWLMIEAAIPNFDLVFQRNPDSRLRPGELKLDQAESELLSLIDGTRSVQGLVDRTRQKPFDICRRLFPLVKLEIVTPTKAPAPRAAVRDDLDNAQMNPARPFRPATREAAFSTSRFS